MEAILTEESVLVMFWTSSDLCPEIFRDRVQRKCLLSHLCFVDCACLNKLRQISIKINQIQLKIQTLFCLETPCF